MENGGISQSSVRCQLSGARQAFTLIELLVTVGIIAILATVVTVALVPARRRANDTARLATLNQIGRFLWASACYAPASGSGEYDLKVIYDEYVAVNPQIAKLLSLPKDPKTGTDAATGYRYVYDTSGKCALYANLENSDAAITLQIAAPTPGGGTGTFQAPAPGPNGTDRYYQISR